MAGHDQRHAGQPPSTRQSPAMHGNSEMSSKET
jgi:hypothetical protein